jgi:hypothetical protein
MTKKFVFERKTLKNLNLINKRNQNKNNTESDRRYY